jgi:hypothetical protein
VTSLSPGIAVYGETSGSGGGADGIHGVAHGTGSGVTGVSDNTNGVGVWADGPGYALYANGNTGQGRTYSGMVKAMVRVNALNPPYSIVGCFNSALSGPAATTPPCGINFVEDYLGGWEFDFRYPVSDRFLSVTRHNNGVGFASAAYAGSNAVVVLTWDKDGNLTNDVFTLFVF